MTSDSAVDLDAILAEEVAATTPGGRCAVGKLLRTMEPDHAAWFQAKLRSELPASVIARTLARAGYDLGRTSIERHRRTECKCPTL